MLRRPDDSLFKLVSDEDALSVAAKLSEGHCFQISLLAVIRVDREQFLQAVSVYHLSHDWYRLDLEQILNCWLECLDSEKGSESMGRDQSPEPEIVDQSLFSRLEAEQPENRKCYTHKKKKPHYQTV